jgi:predicted ATPase
MSGNLPVEPTSLVGRRRELADIQRRLACSRLVTLTGVGGVGKSRLALRGARELAPRFPDGVWRVELGTLQDAAMLPHAIAATLAISDNTARPQIDLLREFLRARRLLLVLDGCEHLITEVARLVAVLLDAAPRLAVLATSRQALGLPGEERVVVEPLPVPGPDDAVDTLRRNESITLFAERAAGAAPGTATAADTRVLAQLCRRLDGIPLAIELAAVRTRDLSVAEVLGRLDDRFGVLAGSGDPRSPARHETLRTTIGWSHELCSPEERLLWARLSVFAGDFDREAAEIVCAGEGLRASAVSDLLAGLVDKSIVLRCSGWSGRFRLLDSIREYGMGWLRDLGEEPMMRRRHRDYYRALVVRREQQWCGPGQLLWCARLEAEHANLRQALDFCATSPGEARPGLELAGALWPLWIARGFTREGRRHIERLLPLDPEPSLERVRASWVLGWVLGAQGEREAALEMQELTGLAAMAGGHTRELACAVGLGGFVTSMNGDHERGAEAMARALETYRDLRPYDIMPLVIKGLLGITQNALGRYDEAIETLTSVRAECTARGELWWRSHLDWALAMVELGAGRPLPAAEHARAALSVKRDFRDRLGVALCLEVLAATATSEGRPGRTARLHGAADRLWRRVGVPQFGSPMFEEIHDVAEHDARGVLGHEAYARALDDGRALNLDKAVAYALE